MMTQAEIFGYIFTIVFIALLIIHYVYKVKTAKKEMITPGDKVRFSSSQSITGIVINDDDENTVKIEVNIPRHLVSKVEKQFGDY